MKYLFPARHTIQFKSTSGKDTIIESSSSSPSPSSRRGKNIKRLTLFLPQILLSLLLLFPQRNLATNQVSSSRLTGKKKLLFGKTSTKNRTMTSGDKSSDKGMEVTVTTKAAPKREYM